MTTPNALAQQIEDRYQLALNIARLAGEQLMVMRSDMEVHQKPDTTLVTNADMWINRMSIETISADYPHDAIIGEEESHTPETSGDFQWYIDPVDGTFDFVHGGKSNGVAIVLAMRSQLLFGMFNNPWKDEFFTARHGAGAQLNGSPIHVNSEPYAPGVSYDYCYWDGAMADTSVFEQTIGPPRDEFSISNQACRVAQGVSAFTAFPGRLPHDILPGAIIVQEAGGTATDLFGNILEIGAATLKGAMFSNGTSHAGAISELRAQ